MKKFLVFALVLSLTAMFAPQTEASKYKLDDQKVDPLFENAITVDLDLMGEAGPNVQNFTFIEMGEKDPLVAILLDIFVGGLGVHRFYLGTKTFTGIGYILTCGGICGLVPLVDLIVLAVNYDDISKYVDNPKFFMW